MLFQNRQEAGKLLAQELKKYLSDNQNLLILALPRGGVPVGFEIARKLKARLNIIICRKIGAPNNSEFAIGAISEHGGLFLNKQIIDAYDINQKYIDDTIAAEQEKIRDYQKEFRCERKGFKSTRNLRPFQTVILVDDGAATGMTMKAAIDAVRKFKPAKIIIALPVAPPDTAQELNQLSDNAIILNIPFGFHAVGQFYENFAQVETKEVKTLLNLANQAQLPHAAKRISIKQTS